MLIDVRGIGFPNKGAELMLAAVLDRVERSLPHARFVVETSRSYDERRYFPVYQRLPLRWRGLPLDSLTRLVHPSLRRAVGVVTAREVDVVLDASGFGYSDQWGVRVAARRLADTRKLARRDVPVIFLPQAYGPFGEPRLADLMRTALLHARLVFARDAYSLAALGSLGTGREVRLAPDFTNALPGKPITGEMPGEVCFVPNARMIDKTSSGTARKYQEASVLLLREIDRSGRRLFVLVMEGQKDVALAEALLAAAGVTAPVVVPREATLAKGLMGRCSWVVSARFHGLVNALSQGVPCIALGWSHKYEALMEDYGCGDLMLRLEGAESRIPGLTARLDDDAERLVLRERLLEASTRELVRTEEMWSLVLSELERNEQTLRRRNQQAEGGSRVSR
jgi:polysaccharide pyruvyl transferase WcaK-like protein